MNILNLTQHSATADQVAAGVFEPDNKLLVQELLTFDNMPETDVVRRRAFQLAHLAELESAESAMIGGAPFFMATLEVALRARGIKPLYSFTRRESADVPDGEGGVKKTQVFRHIGFVEAFE